MGILYIYLYSQPEGRLLGAGCLSYSQWVSSINLERSRHSINTFHIEMSLWGSRAWCWFYLGPGKRRVHEGPQRGFLSDAAFMVGERERKKSKAEGGRSSQLLRKVCGGEGCGCGWGDVKGKWAIDGEEP